MTTVPLAMAEMASLVGSRIRTENETGGECLCLFLVLGLAPSPPPPYRLWGRWSFRPKGRTRPGRPSLGGVSVDCRRQQGYHALTLGEEGLHGHQSAGRVRQKKRSN